MVGDDLRLRSACQERAVCNQTEFEPLALRDTGYNLKSSGQAKPVHYSLQNDSFSVLGCAHFANQHCVNVMFFEIRHLKQSSFAFQRTAGTEETQTLPTEAI